MTPGRDSFQGQVRGLATACSFALTALCGFTCSDTLAQFGGQAACTVTYSAYLSEGNDQLCKHLFMEHKRPSYTHTHTRARALFVASSRCTKAAAIPHGGIPPRIVRPQPMFVGAPCPDTPPEGFTTKSTLGEFCPDACQRMRRCAVAFVAGSDLWPVSCSVACARLWFANRVW